MTPVQEIIQQYYAGTLPPVTPPPFTEAANIEPANRVVLSDLDTNWHPLVAQAVSMAKNWGRRKLACNQDAKAKRMPRFRSPSLVLVASQSYLPDGKKDMSRTGFGCGKTHIAKAVLWSSYSHIDGIPLAPAGKFFTANELVLSLGTTKYQDGYHLIGSCANFVKKGDVLVIDDVGTEETIPFVSERRQDYERHARYFNALNYCYDNGVSVVITANMGLNELESHIGGRAWSRLLEMAPKGFMLDMTGVPDYRRMKGGR